MRKVIIVIIGIMLTSTLALTGDIHGLLLNHKGYTTSGWATLLKDTPSGWEKVDSVEIDQNDNYYFTDDSYLEVGAEYKILCECLAFSRSQGYVESCPGPYHAWSPPFIYDPEMEDGTQRQDTELADGPPRVCDEPEDCPDGGGGEG